MSFPPLLGFWIVVELRSLKPFCGAKGKSLWSGPEGKRVWYQAECTRNPTASPGEFPSGQPFGGPSSNHTADGGRSH